MGVSFGGLRNLNLFHGSQPGEQSGAAKSTTSSGMVPVAPEARAAMQRAGENFRRSRLLKHVTMEKQRREVSAMTRQWAQRAMQGRQAQAPQPTPSTAASGFGLPAQQLIAQVPMLRQQLEALRARGWDIGEKKDMREGDLRAHQHIALNANMARHQPEMFLSTLARHVGVAMHDQQLSLASPQAFELGFLEREAAGALNVIALNQGSPALATAHKLRVDAPMIRAYEALRSEQGGAVPTAAQMAQRVHQEFSTTGQLGMRASGQRRERLADDMQRQYQAFGIQQGTSRADIARVERCFNHTGVAHGASRLAVFATNQTGASYWLDRKHLAGMIHQGAGGFTRVGITEPEIASFVEQALAEGQVRQFDDKHLAVTCHDRQRDQAVQLYVTLGDRPGEIRSVHAAPVSWGHFVRDGGGRERWFNLAHCDPDRNALAVQACATHGVDPQFLPEVIHTAMLKGAATVLAPDAANPDAIRTEYRFTYRHQPMSAVLTTQGRDDQLSDIEIKPRDAAPAAVATGGVATDIASRVGHEQWQKLAAQAANFALPPSTLLEKVARPENMFMPSVEHPGFFQFRSQLAGQTVSVLARMENGAVVDARMPSDFDRILQSCPVQEEQLRSLQRQGWQIAPGNKGEGVYCDKWHRRIALGDPSTSSGPMQFDSLVHEMAHARYGVRDDMRSEDAYAASNAADEGNSLLTEYEALEQFEPGPGRDQHLAYLAQYPLFSRAMPVYQQMQQDLARAGTEQERQDARLVAQTEMGKIYSSLVPSTDPYHVTYDMRWRTFYREQYGASSKSSRIERLVRDQPGLKVAGADGALEAPAMSNIGYIKTLPVRADGPMGRRPGQLFITSETLLEQSQGQDLRVLQNVIASALDHCDAQVEPRGTAAEEAIYRFNLQGQGHQVALQMGTSGQVFSIKHSTSSLWQSRPSEPTLATTSTS